MMHSGKLVSPSKMRGVGFMYALRCEVEFEDA
jgi:hypothetical protein